MKTIVIGLDAATWDVMNPLLSEGDLPNIQRLIKSDHEIIPPNCL